MRNLRVVTKGILTRVEEQTGKTIQFMRDENLKVLASLQMARNGAAFHVLRYSPSDEPLDYMVAFQAGYVLRLFENEPSKRFDFCPEPAAGKQVETLLAAGQSLSSADKKALPDCSCIVAEWALMTLRSLPVGMRIDHWIAAEFPELAEMQKASIAVQQQQNMGVLAYKMGKLTVPTTLLGILVAYALFADRLNQGTTSFAVPFEASGLLNHGSELLNIWDETPADAAHDCDLVDRWAAASGMSGWYDWVPYKP
jgi:hypothetical protein